MDTLIWLERIQVAGLPSHTPADLLRVEALLRRLDVYGPAVIRNAIADIDAKGTALGCEWLHAEHESQAEAARLGLDVECVDQCKKCAQDALGRHGLLGPGTKGR